MTKQITKQQFWQLTGLLALAEETVKRLCDIEDAVRSLLRVNSSDGNKSGIGDPQHIGDAIYGGHSIKMLLDNLGIKRRAAGDAE